MNLSIDFPAEIEAALKQRAAATGQDVAEVVKAIVSEQVQDSVRNRPDQELSSQEKMQLLREIIDRCPPSDGNVDDSRESIYPDRL